MKRQWWRDPVVPSIALFTGISVAGFVTIGLGWHVTAKTLDVGRQMPVIVSGLLVGVALIVIGAGLVAVQAGRRLAAGERAALDKIIDGISTTLDGPT